MSAVGGLQAPGVLCAERTCVTIARKSKSRESPVKWISKIVAINFLFWSFVFLSFVFIWCVTQMDPNTGGIPHGRFVIAVGLLAGLLLAVIVVVPFWVIFKKVGSHPALSVLMLVPLLNLVTLYFIAFTERKVAPTQNP